MPNRILKESICSSESINQLSSDEECLFYRLIVQCDDYGCWDGRLAMIRTRCYPLRVGTVTDKQIAGMLTSLARASLVILYQSEGKPYLWLPGWEKHQQIRAKRRKYPQPPDIVSDSETLLATDSNGLQMLACAPVIQSNPIQSRAPARKRREPSPAPVSVETFRRATGHYPPKSCYGDIANAVADSDGNLQLWESCCHEWVKRGYKPTNVSGMLEWFHAGGPPGAGARASPTQPQLATRNPDGTFNMPPSSRFQPT